MKSRSQNGVPDVNTKNIAGGFCMDNFTVQVPQGYDAEEFTVTFKRKVDGSKGIRVLPPEEA
jgi:hypothetical protein